MCKDQTSDKVLLRLFSFAERSQNSSTQDKLRGREEGKNNLTFSLLCWGAAQGEPSPELSSYPSPELSSYPFICTEGLCGEERDCNAKRDEWHLPRFYSGCSIDLYLLYKGEKTWIAVWVEQEHLPAASWQTAWGLQHED